MPYVTQSQVQAAIPAPHLTDALDDNQDGAADPGLLDSIIAQASQAVEGYLSGLWTVPFPDPAPSAVAEAAFVFTCEMIYQRRSVPEEKNPFSDRAKFWRKRLEQIGNRELPLDAATAKVVIPGATITDPLSADVQST